ncbi:MAG: hypothetical protein ACK5RG_01740 [Cyclobacteriaceae bacterium]|jgi:hypothetical protein|nr:hypothetical protein [Flammeovirgaceae bacterium]
MTTEKLLTGMLWMHIAGGTIALVSGLIAMFATKGGKTHRLAGKIYFAGMTAVFVGALFTAIGHRKDFLLMVAFFSYYMTVRGYRILYLKKLNLGQKPQLMDWIISSLSGVFIISLLGWGIWALMQGVGMGIAGIMFALIGSSFLIADARNFIQPPKEKMHWWYSHISSMGGSYISAVTAFVVVNIQLPQHNWILWILPGIIGGIIIGRTIRKYKVKFQTTAV